MKIAVVGAGVSGLVSAYLLTRRGHEVSLFERESRFGGHSNTVSLPGGPNLDTGFIVYNEPAYPRFSALLAELGVDTQPSDMSFSVTCDACGIQFSSRGARGFLARPGGVLRPSGFRLARDIRRFYREAPIDMNDGGINTWTTAQYLERRRYSPEFIRHFIVPLAAAVWSSPPDEVDGFPATYLLRFLYNHGLVGGGSDRWRWRTVTGGSRSYVAALLSHLPHASSNMPVERITRDAYGATLSLNGGRRLEHFDATVLACHADEALALLGDADADEKRALGLFAYTRNRIVLHTDPAMLPQRPSARASWNYRTRDCRESGANLALTYHLNRLQSVWDGNDYCVSVNPTLPIAGSAIIEQFTFDHPRYTFRTLEGQRALETINGRRHTYFAGAHLGYGFHEDGVRSAYRVASLIDAATRAGVVTEQPQ